MDRRAFSSTNCRAGVIIMISRVETFTRAAASASRRPGGRRRGARRRYVLARRLVLKKVTRRRLRGAQRQVWQLLSLPDELFRVVIKFL